MFCILNFWESIFSSSEKDYRILKKKTHGKKIYFILETFFGRWMIVIRDRKLRRIYLKLLEHISEDWSVKSERLKRCEWRQVKRGENHEKSWERVWQGAQLQRPVSSPWRSWTLKLKRKLSGCTNGGRETVCVHESGNKIILFCKERYFHKVLGSTCNHR